MDVAGCGGLDLGPLTGHWFRALRLRHWENRLGTAHTMISRSRFSPGVTNGSPGPRMLYLGENHQLAFYEVSALLGAPTQPIANPQGSWVLMNLRVRLYHVADLSKIDQQRLVNTNHQELTGIWETFGGEAPTQKLGAALYDLQAAEGLVYPSSKAGGLCLAVFMDRLGPASRIEFELETNNTIEVFS